MNTIRLLVFNLVLNLALNFSLMPREPSWVYLTVMIVTTITSTACTSWLITRVFIRQRREVGNDGA